MMAIALICLCALFGLMAFYVVRSQRSQENFLIGRERIIALEESERALRADLRERDRVIYELLEELRLANEKPSARSGARNPIPPALTSGQNGTLPAQMRQHAANGIMG